MIGLHMTSTTPENCTTGSTAEGVTKLLNVNFHSSLSTQVENIYRVEYIISSVLLRNCLQHNKISIAMPSSAPDTPTIPQPFSIAIVGGGIGGLVFAIGLLKQKIPFHIYEATSQFAEIGAGVAFSPNAVRAMRSIDTRLTKALDEIATGNYDKEHRDIYFQYRWGMDGDCGNGKIKIAEFEDDGIREDRIGSRGENRNRRHAKAGDLIVEVKGENWGFNSVHRGHFLDAVVKLVSLEYVSFGKKVDHVEDLGGGKGVKLYFHDGTTIESSAVVGCDGIKSRVRESLLGKDSAARFTGKYAYRGLVLMDEAVEVLGEELARNSQMHLGYDGHVLTFPIEKGKTMNVVAFQTKVDGSWEDKDWVVPMKRSDMEEDFAAWGQNVKSILSLMTKPDVWALFEHPPAETFSRGSICLLGDAAHASTPHQGAGAGMAVEDAYVLSKLLGRADTGTEGVRKAFVEYDRIRRERTLRLVTTSRECGETYEMQGIEIGDDMKLLRENLKQRYAWIWDEDVTLTI